MSQVGFVIHAEPKEGEPQVTRMVSEGDEFSLREMQGAVKGLIERLPILPHHDLEVWINEEGAYIDSCRTNEPFLDGFGEVLGSVLMGPKMVAGDVLVIETEGLIDHHRDGRIHKILMAKTAPEEDE